MGVGDWIERRLPLRRWLKQTLTEEIPGGASYWYVFGSLTAIDFVVLAATGIWQAFYYVPSTKYAYDSVNYLRFQVPWGWLIHGLHYWAATAMVALVLLHLIQTFVFGAFKKPRELTWILGGVLLLATLAAMFTGTPLPWDKRGYLAAQVANGIAGAVPLIGGLVKQVMWGGDQIGQLALSRFFALHVAVIPIILGGIILLHIITFREPGAAAWFSPKRNESRTGWFWPDQLAKDFLAFSLAFIALVGLSAFLMTPVNGAADPLDATYIGKPEWPFLWLYQVLKLLPGSLEVLGIVVVPLIVLVLLFGVPWLDRKPERAPQKRPVPMAVFVLVLAALVVLSFLGAGGPTEVVTKPSGPASASAATTSSAAVTTPTLQPTAADTVGNADHGATLFVGYCESCHGPRGTDNVTTGTAGPALNPIDPSLKSPDPQAFASNIDDIIQSGSISDGQVLMPAFGVSSTLTQAQIADIEAYVEKLNGVDRAKVLSPGVDPKLFFWVTLVTFALVDAATLFGLWRLRT
jgi:ubiquinol-cytochrome c reductase cytochrome b subunit